MWPVPVLASTLELDFISSRKLSLILLDWSKWLCDEAFLQSSPLVTLLVLWLVKFIRSIVFLNVLIFLPSPGEKAAVPVGCTW